MSEKNTNCPTCHGDSMPMEDVPGGIGWAGGISICQSCGGLNCWISHPPQWDTSFDEAIRTSEKEEQERIRKRINDPSRLP